MSANNRGLDWSTLPAANAALREAWMAGIGSGAIAKSLSAMTGLKITKSMVISRAKRLDLPDRGSPLPGGQVKVSRHETTATPKDGRPRADVLRVSRRQGRPAEVVATLPPVAEVDAPEAAPAEPPPPRPAGPTCCFPMWGNDRPQVPIFCDQPRITNEAGVPRSPYCVAHHRKCFLNVPGIGVPQAAMRAGLFGGAARA
jgi:hypothetical protein